MPDRGLLLHGAGVAARLAELFGTAAAAPLDAEALIASATRRTGLDAVLLDTFAIMEPLRHLVASLRDEARLSAFGRLATRRDLQRLLSNLLILADTERRDTAIGNRPITAPIFVTGLPRSGTSFLHGLLAEDPRNRAPRVWETIHPYPAHEAAERGAGPRKVGRQLRLLGRMVPPLPGMHPMDATSPQECTEINAHMFRSLRFDTTYHVPSYRRWLDREGHDAAYAFHRRFLQHLQGERTETRWVLKSPDHVFALDSLRRHYPDARYVFLRRDFAEVLASVARLTELLRLPFSQAIDRAAIGAQVTRDWRRGLSLLDAAREDAALRDRSVWLDYAALIAHPARAIAQIYDMFGLALPREAMRRIEARIRRLPGGGYGANRHALAPYGLQPEEAAG